jgi:tRNA pseudouridine55 synthase
MPPAILIVNKPQSWTSFDVVKYVRGRCGEKRVGHAGTLDPAATGVLPLLLGSATRLTEYLVDTTKTYEATIELGVVTDTYDADGEVLATADASGVTREQINAALSRFQGEIMQAPPAYSAIKRAGVPLYRMARRGEEVAPEPRPVFVETLEVIDYAAPVLRVNVTCGKGFYVRSLAHDLGAALGVGGSLSGLVRTRVGPFSIEGAVKIEALKAELEAGTWQRRLWAPDEVLLGWRATILGDENAKRLRNGLNALLSPREGIEITEGDVCRAYTQDGDFLAVMRALDRERWRPEKVFLGEAQGARD